MNSNKNFKRRLIISFGVLFIFFISVIVTFRYLQKGPTTGGTPTVLRQSFLWNEKVWEILKSNKRLSVARPKPSPEKKPRVNGGLGLRSPVDLNKFIVSVESGSQKLQLPVWDIKLLSQVGYSTDFRCIEGWSEETQYSGVRFSEFMNHYKIGKKPDGSYYQYVGLETPDKEYYVSIDMESMLHDQTVLAFEMNGAPISSENGAPIRLIIPIKYGIKSLKRIGRIFFSDERPRDYWAERGYDWYSGL